MAPQMEDYFIGVDVGTGSARAALISSSGNILGESTYSTRTWREDSDSNIFEQSTQQIWECISKACRDVVASSGIKSSSIKGIGFDATCSLAVTSPTGSPVSVSPDSWAGPPSAPKDPDYVRDIILWADHRAHAEATLINATNSPVLAYVGGTMSLEMEIPKVLWLKNHMPAEVFNDCIFFDLPDWLTFRATGGDQSRSVCSLGCKCSYVPSPSGGDRGKEGWNKEFFHSIGLEQFVQNDFAQLSTSKILSAGSPVGAGLSAKAAEELGLDEGTAVGSGVIDAYAGWIGTIAAPIAPACSATSTLAEPTTAGSGTVTLEESKFRLAAIAGTSTCHIVQSPEPVFVKGVWGPYRDAIFPGYSLAEAGQSSTGQLLDHMISTHPAQEKLMSLAKDEGINHFALLEKLLRSLEQQHGVCLSELTKSIHIYPDLHGNRSPVADPQLRGMHVGISLDTSVTSLALVYYATLEAIALQTRHIVEALNAIPTTATLSSSSLITGTSTSVPHHQVKFLFLSGGLVKNNLLMQLLADTCAMPVVLPYSHSASVVLGAAMLGAAAFSQQEGHKESLWDIMVKMTQAGSTIMPIASNRTQKLLQVKYEIFRESIELQWKWRNMVNEAIATGSKLESE